jgi:hypothetical protein
MEVQIREVAFRRKFNLGNYETCDIELIATVGKGQLPDEVVKELDRATVRIKQNNHPGRGS